MPYDFWATKRAGNRQIVAINMRTNARSLKSVVASEGNDRYPDRRFGNGETIELFWMEPKRSLIINNLAHNKIMPIERNPNVPYCSGLTKLFSKRRQRISGCSRQQKGLQCERERDGSGCQRALKLAPVYWRFPCICPLRHLMGCSTE